MGPQGVGEMDCSRVSLLEFQNDRLIKGSPTTPTGSPLDSVYVRKNLLYQGKERRNLGGIVI